MPVSSRKNKTNNVDLKMSDKFKTERLEQLKALFPQYREFFIAEVIEIEHTLKKEYPGMRSDERLEKAIMICGLILGVE